MAPAILEISELKNGRLYAVGDVHGCYKELLTLEEKIKKSLKRSGLENFKIISVGDLCDRGPDTKNVIEHFVLGKKAGTHEFVIGNHEMFFLMAFVGLRPDLVERANIQLTWFHRAFAKMYKEVTSQVEIWRVNGGDSVFRSYEADIQDASTWDRVPLSHLQFLFEAPLVIETPTAIISHAIIHEGDLELLRGYSPEVSVDPDPRILTALHRCLWERGFPAKRIDANRRHISGHTPVPLVRRNVSLGAVQIDTGAVYGRGLTAISLSNFRTLAVTSGFQYRRVQPDPY